MPTLVASPEREAGPAAVGATATAVTPNQAVNPNDVLVLKAVTPNGLVAIGATPGGTSGLTWKQKTYHDGFRRNRSPNPCLTNDATGWSGSVSAGTASVNGRVTGLTTGTGTAGFDRATGYRVTNGTTAAVQTVVSPQYSTGVASGLAGLPVTGFIESLIGSSMTRALSLVWYDVNGTLISRSTLTTASVTANQYARQQIWGYAPAGAARVAVQIAASSAVSNSVFTVTCCRIEVGTDLAMTYIDGGTSGMAWSGTSGSSESVATANSGCQCSIWTATVPSTWTPGTIVAPSVSFTNNSTGTGAAYCHTTLDVQRNAIEPGAGGLFFHRTTTMTQSFATTVANSDIDALFADYNGVAGTPAIGGSTGGVLDQSYQIGSGVLGSYMAHYDVTTVATYTIGMSAPTGQANTLMAVEVFDNPTRSNRGNAGTLALTQNARGVARKINPQDSLQRRIVDETDSFATWLNGANGWISEWGAVTNLAADKTAWDAAAEQYLTDADYWKIWNAQWAAGRGWGTGYPLGSYVSSTVGGAIDTAQPGLTSVMEAHRTWLMNGFMVNLSGMENGVQYNGGGSVRTATLYPPTGADASALAGRGVKAVRLPITWERIQPTLMGALDTNYCQQISDIVTAFANAGIYVVLDLHNYARYTAADGSVYAMVESGSNLNISHLVDVWRKIGTWVRSNTYWQGAAIYELMNEPHHLAASGTRAPWQVWEYAMQQVVDALRADGETRTIGVSLYDTSQLINAAATHPNGPWITGGGAIRYVAHHYWDTRSALGARSGTYQMPKADGSAGVEIETYAYELAAAVDYYTNRLPQFGALLEDWSAGLQRGTGQKWAQTYDGGGGNPAPTVINDANGFPALQVTAISGNQYSGARTDYVWRLSPGRIRVRVPKVLALNGGTSVETRIIVDAPSAVVAGGTRLAVTMKAQSGQIEFRNESGYYEANPTALTYDATQHQYWGLRADDYNLFFETSADGLNWTIRRTIAVPTWIKSNQLRLTMEATRADGTTDTALFGRVNTDYPLMNAKSGFGNAGVLPLGAQRGVVAGIQVFGNGLAPATLQLNNQRGLGSPNRTGVGSAPATLQLNNQRATGSFSTRQGSGRAPNTFVYDQRGVRSAVSKTGFGRATGLTDSQRATGSKAIAGRFAALSGITFDARGTGMQVRPGFGNAGVLPLGAIRGLGQPYKTGTGRQPALAWGNPAGRAGAVTRAGSGRVTGLQFNALSGAGGRLVSGYGNAGVLPLGAQRATGQKQISRFARATDLTLTLTTRARGSAARTGRGFAPATGFIATPSARGYCAGQTRNGWATAYGLANWSASYGPKNIFGRGQARRPIAPFFLQSNGTARGYRAMYGNGRAKLELGARGTRPAEIPDYFPFTRPQIVRPFTQEDIRIVAQHARTREILHPFVPLTDAKLKVKISGATEITGTIKPEILALKGKDGRPLFKDWSTLLHFEIDGDLWGTGIVQPMGATDATLTITAMGLSAYPEDVPYLATWSKVNVDAIDVLQEGWRYIQSFPNSQLGINPPRTINRLPNRLGLEPKEIKGDNAETDANGDPVKPDLTIEKHKYDPKDDYYWKFLGRPFPGTNTLPGMGYTGYFDDKNVWTVDIAKSILDRAQDLIRSNRDGTIYMATVNANEVPQNVWDSLVYQGYASYASRSAVVPDNILQGTLKGVFKPWEMLEHEGPMIGAKINETVKAAQVDFLETTKWVNDRRDTVQNIVLTYPRVGDVRTGQRFVQGENIISVVDPAQLSDFGASAMWGVGNGDGKASIRRTIEDLSDQDRIRRVATYKNARVKDPVQMDALLRRQLASRKETLEIPSIVVQLFHRNAKLGEYWVGDDILVQAETRWWGWVSIWHRIIEIEIDAQRQLSTLTLRRSDSFLYGSDEETS